MSPCLTIAIPFYRGHSFLRAAVESVRRQTSQAWTLIICDDCGPEEGTQELVRSFGDPRIAYRRNSVNLGMARNWNRCIEMAETDLVTLLHADDELRPHYIEWALESSERHPCAVAHFCAADIIGPDGSPRFSLPDAIKKYLWPIRRRASVIAGRRAIEALCLGNFLMCPTACYRKSILGRRRFDPRWQFVLDLELFTRLLLEGEQFAYDPARNYAYRRHAGSATEQYTQTSLRFAEESALYDELAARVERLGWHQAAVRARVKLLVRVNVVQRALRDLVGGHFTNAGRGLLTALGCR